MEARHNSLLVPNVGMFSRWPMIARRTMALVALGVIVLAGGCHGPGGEGEPATGGEGDPATWQLLVDVTAQSTDLEIEVTRLGCASGATGEVLEPKVNYEEQRIVIEVDVAPYDADAADCQENDAVPISVDLDEPVGERDLIDGACLDGEAMATTYCETAVRWP